MQKLIILLKGISRLQTPPIIDGFTRIAGYDDLVWGGKLIEIEDFNSVASQVFGKARIPDGYHIAVQVIDEIEAEEPTEYLGEDLLPDLDLKKGETPQDVLKAVCNEVYNGSIVDWNNLEDLHKRNLINKAFSVPPGGQVPDPDDPEKEDLNHADPKNIAFFRVGSSAGNYDAFDAEGNILFEHLTKGEVKKYISDLNLDEAAIQSNEAVIYKHRGNGKYDVYDAGGNVVLDNVTEEEAEEAAPGGRVPEPDPETERKPETDSNVIEVTDEVLDQVEGDYISSDEEPKGEEPPETPSVDLDEASKDLESKLHWKKFETKYGLKPKEFKEKHNL